MSKQDSTCDQNKKDVITIKEDDALKYLQLKESIYYPNRSWKGYVVPAINILLGLILGGILLFHIMNGEGIDWFMVFMGIYFFLGGLFRWHKTDVDTVHKRIDAIVELYLKDKKIKISSSEDQTEESNSE